MFAVFRVEVINASVATTKEMPDYMFGVEPHLDFDDYNINCIYADGKADANTAAPLAKFVSDVPVDLVCKNIFYI